MTRSRSTKSASPHTSTLPVAQKANLGPARQMKQLSPPKPAAQKKAGKTSLWIPDEASTLRGTIHTNNANIGHYTRRGDVGAASALRSQTAILERQLQALEEAKEKAKPKPGPLNSLRAS